jgi:hypothetical protein
MDALDPAERIVPRETEDLQRSGKWGRAMVVAILRLFGERRVGEKRIRPGQFSAT